MARTKAPRRRDAETTRAGILSAARQRFAADGYERTTIRAVAGEAGIDPALVMRYFGNKEKLFAAAADFDLRLPDLGALPRAEVGAALARHFIDRWEADDTFMALLRVAVTNEAAAKQVRAVFAGQVLPVVAALSGEPATAGLRAGLAATQILGVALARYVLLLPPVVGMSKAALIRSVGATLERYIFGELEGPDGA